MSKHIFKRHKKCQTIVICFCAYLRMRKSQNWYPTFATVRFGAYYQDKISIKVCISIIRNSIIVTWVDPC